MTNVECGMRNERFKYKLRWLLAVLDGFWALGFLSMGYLSVSVLFRLLSREMNKLNSDVVSMPHLTTLFMDVIPEPGWTLLVGAVCLSAAYGRLSFLTQDSITTRLFRWSLVVLMFVLLSACLPLFDMWNPLPRPVESEFWFDEAAFVALSFMLVVWAFVVRGVNAESRHS